MAIYKETELIRVPTLRAKLERCWRGFELVTQSKSLLNQWVVGPSKLFNARLFFMGIFFIVASCILIGVYFTSPNIYRSESTFAFVGLGTFFAVTLASTYSILRLIVSFFVVNNICELAIYVANKGLRKGSQVYLSRADAIRASRTLDMLVEVRRFTYKRSLFALSMVLMIAVLGGLGIEIWFGVLLVSLVVSIEHLANYGDRLSMGLIARIDDFGRDDLLFEDNFLL